MRKEIWRNYDSLSAWDQGVSIGLSSRAGSAAIVRGVFERMIPPSSLLLLFVSRVSLPALCWLTPINIQTLGKIPMQAFSSFLIFLLSAYFCVFSSLYNSKQDFFLCWFQIIYKKCLSAVNGKYHGMFFRYHLFSLLLLLNLVVRQRSGSTLSSL